MRRLIFVSALWLLEACAARQEPLETLTVSELRGSRHHLDSDRIAVTGFVSTFGNRFVLVPGFDGHCSSEPPSLVLGATAQVSREQIGALLHREVVVRGRFRNRLYPLGRRGAASIRWSTDTVIGPLAVASLDPLSRTCRTL